MGTTTSAAAQGDNKVTSLEALRGVGKMTASVAVRERGGNTIGAFFNANKEAIAAVLPKHMTPERMMKIAVRCLRTTPKLMECTLDSLFGAVVTSASLGLEPNTPQGHLYLIPFENRQKGITEVQVIIGYKGLIDLARRSGQIVSISSRVRCANDPWKMKWGTDDIIDHEPADGERGPIVGFYATAKLKDGGTQFEYMTLAEVERIRNDSQGYRAAQATAKKYSKPAKHPWVDHFEEMGRKSLIRRLCKYLPMSIELAHAVELDGTAEGGKTQGLGAVLEGVDYTVHSEDAPGESFDPDTGEVSEAPATPAPPQAAPPQDVGALFTNDLPPQDDTFPGDLPSKHDAQPERTSRGGKRAEG